MLIRHYDEVQKTTINIIVDPSKTFNLSMKRLLESDLYQNSSAQLEPFHVLLTHYHDDACLGLGDIREFGGLHFKQPIPFYCRPCDYLRVEHQFPYLFDTSKVSKASLAVHFDYVPIKSYEPFYIGNLKITPLPCFHGEDMICIGFKFGEDFAYFSDANGFPYETWPYLYQIDTLVLDCLTTDGSILKIFTFFCELFKNFVISITVFLFLSLYFYLYYCF